MQSIIPNKRKKLHFLKGKMSVYLKAAGIFLRMAVLMGHKNVKTTIIYAFVMKKPGIDVKSPLDNIM